MTKQEMRYIAKLNDYQVWKKKRAMWRQFKNLDFISFYIIFKKIAQIMETDEFANDCESELNEFVKLVGEEYGRIRKNN